MFSFFVFIFWFFLFLGLVLFFWFFFFLSFFSSSFFVCAVQVLLQRLVEATSPAALQAHLAAICKPVIACIGDQFYKIVSEALAVTLKLVHSIRPDPTQPLNPAFAGLVHDLYSRLPGAARGHRTLTRRSRSARLSAWASC
jgi:hypothetical protein